MKRIVTLSVAVLAASAGVALAENEVQCNVPMDQWQTEATVTAELLQTRGWAVRRIKIEGGCYDVFAIDANGQRIQAALNPRTLKVLGTEIGG